MPSSSSSTIFQSVHFLLCWIKEILRFISFGYFCFVDLHDFVLWNTLEDRNIWIYFWHTLIGRKIHWTFIFFHDDIFANNNWFIQNSKQENKFYSNINAIVHFNTRNIICEYVIICLHDLKWYCYKYSNCIISIER